MQTISGRIEGENRNNRDAHESEAADWERAHTELVRLARSRAAMDWHEGRWFVCALRSGSHVRLGYGAFAEYIERIFGYSPRFTSERLRVAEALEELPELSQALRDGALSWSAIRELTRVATPKTEGDWVESARKRSVREIEKLVSGHRPGDHPDDRADPKARRHVLRFEISGETLATFREAMAKLRRDAGEPLDDDAALLLMARQVLGGPQDDRRASYQIKLDKCEDCGRVRQQGRGELVDVGTAVAEMAACDAQHIRATDSDTQTGKTLPKATQTIPPAARRLVMRRDAGRCVVPGCRHGTFLDVHHLVPRADGGKHDRDSMVVLCGAHHRALHDGRLAISGSVSAGLVFRHADGSEYGLPASPRAADARSRVFRFLRSLGVKESESRRALEKVATHAGADANTESILRKALEVLTAGVWHTVGGAPSSSA